MKMLPEPYRIKMVESIKLVSAREREKLLKEAGYNLFLVPAEAVFIDLLTDSGTGAMSDRQWSALMRGDESYANARSWFHFRDAVQSFTGMEFILPTHQGRAAENILFSEISKPGRIVPSNNHFDTTRANCEFYGAEALDLVIPEGKDPHSTHPFKGNIDLGRLEDLLKKDKDKVPVCMCTITNNTGGGQPVSLENIRQASAICHKYGVPFFIDACRFAENSYFIKQREEKYKSWTIEQIAKETFSCADGATMSAKKDGLSNIGGFLAVRDRKLYESFSNALILREGFLTYGGLAGRDLEALAAGFEEVMDEAYLASRIGQVAFLGEMLRERGVPFLEPPGGHAIYLNALEAFPHIKREQFAAQSLCVALYLEGGIRGVEIGSLMFGKTDAKGNFVPSTMELVRLAIPRRVYTESHMRYVADVAGEIVKNRDKYGGYRITYEAPFLRHFTMRLEPA